MMNHKRPKVLVVDDGDRTIELAHALLRAYTYATRCELGGPCWHCKHRSGCRLTHAHDWAQTVQALAKHPDTDVVLLDLVFDLPEERLLRSANQSVEQSRQYQGLEILGRLRRDYGRLPVVLMTSKSELQFEAAADELAVDEFVTLAGADAFDARALGLLMERIIARKPRTASEDVSSNDYYWGRFATMAKLRRDVQNLAKTSLPMLLFGETGTGKSALAKRVIHPATGRSGPFVNVDLAAVPENLVAAELFGTVRGAFSGAIDRVGCFERARGGTLLLDEIGNLTSGIQRLLLVSLQERRFRRLGESVDRPLDVKLIAATNSDLKTAVDEGRFRLDLYARLNPAASLKLPNLRERIADLDELMALFVRRAFAKEIDAALLTSYMETAQLEGPKEVHFALDGSLPVPTSGITFVLQRQSRQILGRHGWPGNLRELELLMANAAILTLFDALEGVRSRRVVDEQQCRMIPIPAKLIRDFIELSGNSKPQFGGVSREELFNITPKSSIGEVVRDVERQLFERFFIETKGDFEKMARCVLRGDPATNARRMRLRFNQLGLRVKQLKNQLDREP